MHKSIGAKRAPGGDVNAHVKDDLERIVQAVAFSSVEIQPMSQRLIEHTIPVLAVSDLARSIDFYRRVLGFEVEWSAATICSVARDHCSIMLEAREELAPSTVWVGLDGDSIFKSIEQSGAAILQPPTNRPWAYEMKIADPDGNVIWLGAEPKE